MYLNIPECIFTPGYLRQVYKLSTSSDCNFYNCSSLIKCFSSNFSRERRRWNLNVAIDGDSWECLDKIARFSSTQSRILNERPKKLLNLSLIRRNEIQKYIYKCIPRQNLTDEMAGSKSAEVALNKL